MDGIQIGETFARVEDPRLVRGGGRYLDDIAFAGMVFGHVLRSPHAHAGIRSIDTAAAERVPGVLAVLTVDDYLGDGVAPIPASNPALRNGQGIKPFTPARLPLAQGKVRFVGDAVAFIVAETRATAREAAELVEVDYEPLPALISTAEAANHPGISLWDEQPNNICFVHELGNEAAVDAAFAEAAHIVRQRLVIPRVAVSTMETRGCVASYDRRADFFTIQACVQSVYTARGVFASVFKEPDSKFRIIADDVGGSFGMKGGVYPEYILTAWASHRLGLPVKWIADRGEAFTSDNHGRDNVTDAALALDKDGKFLAFKVATHASVGGYVAQNGAGPPTNNLGGLAGVYNTPAVFVRVTGVFTNNNPTGAYRGAGRPEASYVLERMVDLAARELGIDRIEIRRRNMIPQSALPFKTGLVFTYDSGDFETTMNMALQAADYRNFETRRALSKQRGKYRGIGIACVIERAAAAGFEAAQISVAPSGQVTIVAGTTDQGQGHKTMYTQLAAARLGLDPAKIRVIEGDTDKLSHGSGTGGSRVSTLGNSALVIAGDKLVAKGKKIAAHLFETPADDVDFEDGNFFVAGTNHTMSIGEIAKIAHQPARLPRDVEPGFSELGAYRADVANYPNGCQICELEIDPETGFVEILRYVVVDDVGTVINPQGVKGQIHGGVVQGLGEVFMEEVVYDPESGQILTGSFLDYCMPKADNFCDFEVGSNPVPTPTNPLGVKGVGEAGTVGALPAAMNAVMDALAPLGIRHLDMPATGQRLWQAIQAATSS